MQQQQQFQHFHHHHHHHQQPIQQVQSDSQLEHRTSPDLERNRDRDRQQNRSSMDFRNLCQRLDVDSLRAKLPSLPQIKLPKALPKLRGRKIFRSSKSGSTRANAGSTKDRGYSGPPQQQQQQQYQSQLQVAATSQQFINRTPQRISTISSLMYEGGGGDGAPDDIRRSESQPGTYRSAGSLDDDYYAPGSGERASRPISPIKIPSGSEEAAGSSQPPTLTQRIQRGYKSLSELRLKHIFAKQTTVRRDNIEVDRYVEQYERELKSEKRARERRDREIAENYDIQIKTLAGTRQNTFEEDEVEHEQFERNKGHHHHHHHQDTDESGLEATPPLPSRRKPGIAATRFAKVRKPPLEMEASGEQEPDPDQDRDGKTSPPKENQPPPRSSSYKQLLSKLPHLPNLPNLPQLSRAKPEKESKPEATTKSGLRQNIKRIRKSIKRPAKLKPKVPASQDTDDEEESEEKKDAYKDSNKAPTSSTNLRARLGRFASTEQLQQRWRKSFKRTKDETPKEETSAVVGGVLGGFLLGSQLEKTLGKLNEKMHQIKFFQRQGQAAKEPKPNTVGHEPVELDDDNELAATYHHSDSDDSGEDVSADEAFGEVQPEDSPEHLRKKKPLLEREREKDSAAKEQAEDQASIPAAKATHASRQMAKLAEIQAASKGGAGTTAWSSESLEEIADEDYPRVLIHQEHSDNFESTLIIAVATKNPTPSPQQPGPPKASPWLPNDQIIAGFKQEAAWPAPALYKPKSIDIFEASGGGTAFADFDEALRNAPVLRISAGSIASSIEEKDEGHTRVTRIRVQSPQIGNSRESLMAQDEEEEEEEEEEPEEDEDDEEEDLEMELPVEAIDLDDSLSERPPSASPPPPPLPQRRPPPIPKAIDNTPIYDAVPPPLPITKPPENEAKPEPKPAAARVSLPQRSASMSRPAKPLVKTSSLRLTYNEQVRPGDIGKVNKLISRFEGGRPRLCPRRMHSEEYERACDEEEEVFQEVLLQKVRAIDSVTPTNRNVVVIPQITLNNNNNTEREPEKPKEKVTTADPSLDRQNSNCSRSEYGSPLAFPSNRRSSTPTNNNNNPTIIPSNPNPNPNPNPITIQHQRRSRRSMTRDDDNFYSFDSDEENSYYSISPSGSSRYVVEI